jgi:hypothetical protein
MDTDLFFLMNVLFCLRNILQSILIQWHVNLKGLIALPNYWSSYLQGEDGKR